MATRVARAAIDAAIDRAHAAFAEQVLDDEASGEHGADGEPTILAARERDALQREGQLARPRHHLRLQLRHLLLHAPLEAGVERGQLRALLFDDALVGKLAPPAGVEQPRQRHADEVDGDDVRQVGQARAGRSLLEDSMVTIVARPMA